MLQFKRVLKSILKYRTSSGLTMTSLIISFTGIIILTLYVSWEKSFDKFHEDADSVYRLETTLYGNNVPAIMGKIIRENTPEVDALTATWGYSGKITTPKLNETNVNYQASMLFAENSFLDIFTFPLISGDKKTALAEPHSAVISESLSDKMFGGGNPIGENIVVQDIQYKVTGVMKDFPKNSSFQTDCLLSFSTYLEESRYSYFNQWNEWSFNVFMKLHPGSKPDEVADKIVKIDDISQTVSEMQSSLPEGTKLIELRPLKQIHYVPGQGAYVNPVILNIFILLIVILSVMGAVNFINFATSQAPLRAKALSVIRVLGGRRLSSMGQIIAESVLLSLAAMIVSLLIYRFSYAGIESFFGIRGLALDGRYLFLGVFFLFALAFGALAGFYPSRYVTSSPLAQAVKGNAHFTGKGKSFRNTLVTIQFIFTIGLIASSFIIEKQLNFWRNFDIGIDKEHVVYLTTTPDLQERYQAFADELMKNKDIVDYTYTQFIPGSVGMGWGRNIEGQYVQMKCWPIDERFLNFFGIKMDEGREFGETANIDVNTFILNKKGVEEFGWENPLDRQIPGFDFTGQIIGVAKDFNFSSLKEDVEPMIFWRTNGRKNRLLLRLSQGNYTQTIAYIKNTAQKFDSKNPVEVQFLDDSLNLLYNKEEKIARFIEFVALWTILLAVTGLLGLIIFMSRDRIKEIGVRKVNGATISEVIVLLNKDFVRWVAIAFVIATPAAYYAMHKWLENFAYKITLSWWIFALAGLLALGIALLTVSWQSWRAATRNPVEALRYE